MNAPVALAALAILAITDAPPEPLPATLTGDGWTLRATATVLAACAANCDGSAAAPMLTTADLACFLRLYTAGDPRANCDHSTTTPLLTAADFTCFLHHYSAGCP
jgi:hypothetical protein